jgi:hypothetical protein
MSGTISDFREMVAVEKPETMKAAGAKRALILPVGGAFHSQ